MNRISNTAHQQGYGSDPWKHVGGLTKEEKSIIRAGGTVVFQADRPSGGNHGTYWRKAIYHRVCGFLPRVASAEEVRVAFEEDAK